jgi:hypothetical protein
MDLEGGGDSRVQGVEELAELAGPLPAMALADHLAALGVERRKQGRRAVARVVVGAGLHLPRSHGQNGLGPIERLDLAFSSTQRTSALSGGSGAADSNVTPWTYAPRAPA